MTKKELIDSLTEEDLHILWAALFLAEMDIHSAFDNCPQEKSEKLLNKMTAWRDSNGAIARLGFKEQEDCIA